jgi:hypothetical protein
MQGPWRWLLPGFLLGFFLSFGASCGGTTAAHCDARSCASGCCDATNHCQPGGDPQACGTSGNACRVCPLGDSCNQGVCLLGNLGGGSGSTGGGVATGGGFATGGGVATGGGGTTSCSPSNCSGCCSTSGACQTGTGATACGHFGQICSNCSALGRTCDAPSGLCITGATGGGGGSACAGCTDINGNCFPFSGQTLAFCGANGARCAACQTGQACTQFGCLTSGTGGGGTATGGGAGTGGGCTTITLPSAVSATYVNQAGSYELTAALQGSSSAYLELDVVWSLSGAATGVVVPSSRNLALEPNFNNCLFCATYATNCVSGSGCTGPNYFARSGTMNAVRADRADAGTTHLQLTSPTTFQQWDLTNDVPVTGGGCVTIQSADILASW